MITKFDINYPLYGSAFSITESIVNEVSVIHIRISDSKVNRKLKNISFPLKNLFSFM